mgnify:CR=1 FL=1
MPRTYHSTGIAIGSETTTGATVQFEPGSGQVGFELDEGGRVTNRRQEG